MSLALKKEKAQERVNIIELWRYLSDHRSYFSNLTDNCIKCIQDGKDHEELWSEIYSVFNNEYRAREDVWAEQRLFDIYKAALFMGQNLRAYEVMDMLSIAPLKFSAYMLYAGRLKKYCGKEYADVYYRKAKRIAEEDETVKRHLIKTKNITLYLGGHND